MTTFRVGTSGWHYKHWRGRFYPNDLPTKQWLDFYTAHFDTVEINRSFYRLLTAKAVADWYVGTPKKFLFAVKGSRFITHMKKLKDPNEALPDFIDMAVGFGDKLGPILFQLPPHWCVNIKRFIEFLHALPKQFQYTFEFRERSWHSDEIYRLLERFNMAFCIYDINGYQSPYMFTADFAYLRFHGPGAAYQGLYSQEWIEALARDLKSRKSMRAIYVYFDNDQDGYAAINAAQLKSLLA